MKTQIIQLEPYDDVNSVRDKLGWVRAPRVLLVFPPGQSRGILRTRLDLVLLQREAARHGAQLALVTEDPIIREHAHTLGVAAFDTVDASNRRAWRTRPESGTRTPRPTAPPAERAVLAEGRPDEPEPVLLPPALQRTAVRVLIAVLVVLGAAALLLLGPGATVTLYPASNQISVTTTITADPQAEPGFVDADAAVIAARLVGVEVEGSTSVATTGTLQQPSQHARGIVIFSNRGAEQVNIPSGTVVRTSAAQPVRFATLLDATLPAQVGETVEVAVEALDPGFEGNVPAGRINRIDGALDTRAAVTNPEPTRGGEAEEVPAVSEQDQQRVSALLLQQLQQRALAEMETSLLDDHESIPLESLRVVLVHSETYSGYVGEPAGNLSLSMRVTVQGVALDERLARQVVYKELADKVGPGYQIGSSSLVFRVGDVTATSEGGAVTFVMHGAGDISAEIPPDEVATLVRGRTIRAAEQHLERAYPLTAPPHISMWPSFWPLTPLVPLRINVQTGETL